MRRGLPIWPLVNTVVAVSAANALIAYGIVQASMQSPLVQLSPPAVIGLIVLSGGCAVAAVLGWRSYLRVRSG